MKNINIGIVNFMISNKLKESYFDSKLLGESKKQTFDFYSIVKNSPILQLEFKVFSGIENKFIDNELTASRYIDNSIKLFEVYTIDEINAERKKLKPFITEATIPMNSKIALYNAIDNLITESLCNYDEIDVDIVHESFTLVLNHIKEPKTKLIESVEHEGINDDIIEMAVDKFNSKYKSLDESDRSLFNKLTKSTNEEKQALLEEYKNENLLILEKLNKNNVEDNISKTIQKIKEMKYKKTDVEDDIIKLHELKKGLL